MKIGFITRETPFSKRCGGIGTYIWDNAQKLNKLGHSVVIITASDQVNEKRIEFHDGIKVIFLNGADFFIGNQGKLSLIYSKIRSITKYKSYRKIISNCIEDLIDENKLDIVEFAEYGNESFIWKKLSRRIPMIIRLHTPSIMVRKTQKTLNPFLMPLKFIFANLELKAILDSNAISSPSLAMANFFKDTLDMHLKNLHIIYNGINPDEWSMPLHENNNKQFTIFSAGSVVNSKGYGELFQACLELNNEGYEIKLNIAGSIGNLGRELNLKKLKNPSLKWFNLLGNLDRKSLAKHYNNANVVCFPSWWENLPMVCLEAMASGAIVIGGREGGMSEIIDDGLDGFLVEPKNVPKLKKTIKKIFNLNKSEGFKFKVNAKQKINEKFNSNNITHDQINFYRKCIKEFEKK